LPPGSRDMTLLREVSRIIGRTSDFANKFVLDGALRSPKLLLAWPDAAEEGDHDAGRPQALKQGVHITCGGTCRNLLHLEDLDVTDVALVGALLVLLVTEGDRARTVLALVEAEVRRHLDLGKRRRAEGDHQRADDEGENPQAVR